MQRKARRRKCNQLSDPLDVPEHQVNAHSLTEELCSGIGRKMFVPIPTDAHLASHQSAPDHNSYQQRTISVRISIIFLNYLATCGCLGKLLRVRTLIITEAHSLKNYDRNKPLYTLNPAQINQYNCSLAFLVILVSFVFGVT